MKGGRSVQRPQIQRDPHPAAADDWVDGSWTVDCICGVNFDDGEEMVNCDDCGVWVHTRCSRYVKGEDLFTCDKCKRKNNTNFNLRNSDDSEETEVAQFLVELPTKTIRLESTSRSNVHVGPAVVRRPFRLWTDVPMEDRVHVQGVPGGDPGLFSGLGSSVFSPALWKCTGLVPKKFNFQYREFPCWDEEEDRGGDGNEGDKGAGVLFSLSKGNGVVGRSMNALVGMRGRDGDGRCGGKVGVKDVNKCGAEDGQVRGLNFGVKKERSFLRPAVLQSNKRKKDDLGMGKDRSARKKARSADREVDVKKRSSSASRTVFTSTSDSKTLERCEDRGPTSIKSDSQTNGSKNLRVSGILRSESDGHGPPGNGAGKVKDDFEQIECSSEAFSADMSRHDPATGTEHKEGKAIHEVSEVAKNSPTADNIAASALEHSDASRISVKQEGENAPNGNLDNMEDSAVNDVKPSVEHLTNAPSEVKDDQVNGDGEMLPPFRQPNVKLEVDDDNSRGLLDGRPALADVKDAGAPTDKMPVDYETAVAPLGGLPSDDHTPQDVDRTLEAVVDCHKKKGDELSCDPYQVGKEMEQSQGSMLMQREQSKSGSPTSQTRTTICEERLPSSLSTAMISKSSASENLRSVDVANAYPTSKQQSMSESTNKEEQSTSSVVKDTDRHDIPRKAGKEHQRSSMNSASRAPNSSKMLHSACLRTVSDSKDAMPLTSSKMSSVQNSSEASGSQQNECALHVQSKASVKGDKFNLSNTQPPLKANHLPLSNSSAPTSSSTTLSDEELALLLHQELNSSPRVPRVPRVRHAGSLPQLASPTAASMFLKRTLSSGGKDHGSFSRRKNKDVSKDAFRHSHEPDDGAKKTTNRVPSSPDLRRQDSGNPSSRREDGNSLAGANSVKKNVSPTSTSTANSGPSLSTEFNDNHMSSTRNSPRNISDEETGTAGGPVHRTLPGLINEIMSKGKRMTYEELCNAVLPHWHNLRKHNGERYAYSSHSQAVLDCLRNRHEWAQLVDRGPKTNTNRKKRKVDAEESEDNGYSKGKTPKDGEGKSLESQREEFPKGKRKARKRKLALQGKGLKDAKKRRKADSITDDDSGTFITSSEQSLSSEDEIIQGGGAGSDGSEASDSSDEGGET